MLILRPEIDIGSGFQPPAQGLPARPSLKTSPRANGDKDPSENFNNKPTDRSAKPKEIQHLQDVQQLKEEQKIETEDAAQSRLDAIIPALAKAAGATEALKAADQMKWVGIMNACKAQAEEVIFQEIIFA